MLKFLAFFLFIPLLLVTNALGSEELSLKQDRKHLDELRKDIPEDVKKENDDLAFLLKLFEDKSRQPMKIRKQFDQVYNRLRKNKQKEFKKERDDFTKKEKKNRKTFISDAKNKRKKFLDGNPSKESKKEFFEEERTNRKEYFAEEREKRKDFESDLRARRKEHDGFLKDKRKEFDDRLRQFKKEQKEMKDMQRKAEMQRSRPKSLAVDTDLSPTNKQYLQDFSKIPKRGGHTLAPPDEK